MLNNLHRDYLLERGESMINRRENSRAEGENWSRNTLRQPAMSAMVRVKVDMPVASEPAKPVLNKGEGTTIYPRLSLGPTQRFASKGGYIVRFADTGSDKLVAESGWIIP
jgi:hypothetical protein